MKRKIGLMVIIMMLGLTGCKNKNEEVVDNTSTAIQNQEVNEEEVEEAIKNREFEDAKNLTLNNEKYENLHKGLNTFLDVQNRIVMQYVHVVLDLDSESELEADLKRLKEIPKDYKKYSELKEEIDIYKDGLQEAVDLEKKFRKNFEKLDEAYKANKSDEYTDIGQEWMEEVEKTFPVKKEDTIEANLSGILNDIFANALGKYITNGYDPSKMEGFESPWEKSQENQTESGEEFDPYGGVSSKYGVEDTEIDPDDLR